MSNQYVYLTRGVDIEKAEHIRRWLSRGKNTFFTTDKTMPSDCASPATSLICIPDGDVEIMTTTLGTYAGIFASFVNRGGTLVVLCGGYHALSKTKFFEYLEEEKYFNVKESISPNTSSHAHSLQEARLVKVSFFNNVHSPQFALSTSSTMMIDCCLGCSTDYGAKYETYRSSFEKDTFIPAVYSETKGTAIKYKFVRKGAILVMSVIPIDYNTCDLDFVLDMITKKESFAGSIAKNITTIFSKL